MGAGTRYFTSLDVRRNVAGPLNQKRRNIDRTGIDPSSGDTYQVTQAMRAFQQGGWFGRGPGEGRVKEALPDAHTDFIFAVAGEEFGIFLCLLIVALFAFIVIRALTKAMREENMFVLLAVGGLAVQFGLQAMIDQALDGRIG